VAGAQLVRIIYSNIAFNRKELWNGMIAAIKKNEVHLIGNNNKMRLVIY
jgi:hypothetical protein